MNEFGSVHRLRVIAASRSGFWLAQLGFLIFVIALMWVVSCVIPDNPSRASVNSPAEDVSFATRDGLLAATFFQTTDDSELSAAAAGLVA